MSDQSELMGRALASMSSGVALIDVRVSAGVAVYPGDAATPSALLLAADEAMYAVKRARH